MDLVGGQYYPLRRMGTPKEVEKKRACNLPASAGHVNAAPITRMAGSDRDELHKALSLFVDPCMHWPLTLGLRVSEELPLKS